MYIYLSGILHILHTLYIHITILYIYIKVMCNMQRSLQIQDGNGCYNISPIYIPTYLNCMISIHQPEMLGNAGNVFFPHQALFLVTSKSEVGITCYNMSMFFICKVVIICYYDPLWEPQALHLQICKFFMGSLMPICPRISDGHPMVSESCANLPRV